MAIYKYDRHAFKWRVTFNTTAEKELPNGLTVTVPVPAFQRWAAIHKASSSYIRTLDGFDRRHDIIIAINAIYKDPIDFQFDIDAYSVTLKGKDYVIRLIDADEGVEPNGYHLFYLRDKKYQIGG